MLKKMTKGRAFVFGFIGVMAIFFTITVMVLVKKADITLIPHAACLGALCSLVGGYFTLNVVDSGVKGHNWNQEMFDSLNKTETGGKDD